MRRKITNVEMLTRRWADAYGERLRHRLIRGTFRFIDHEGRKTWRHVGLEPGLGCWGGEPAADAYLSYLRPLKLTLYSDATIEKLSRALRIVPDPEGSIEVLDKFWRGDIEVVDRQSVVPDVVAYADLLMGLDSRTLETAQMLFDDWKRRNEHR